VFFEVNSKILRDMAGYNLAEFTTPAASAATLSANLAAIAQLREPHIQTMQKQLSDKIKPILDLWLMRGRTVEEFFELNAAQLGHPNLYDLTGFHAPDSRPQPEKAKKPFPTQLGVSLLAWLAMGKTIAAFFRLHADVLGSPDQYDMTPYTTKAKISSYH